MKQETRKPRHGLNFQGHKHLREWLANSSDGRQLIEALTGTDKEKIREWLTTTEDGRRLLKELWSQQEFAMVQRVLAVQHHDHVALYGPDSVRVKVVTQVYDPGREVEAEQAMEAALPLSYKDVFWPGNKLADVSNRTLTPMEVEYYDAMQVACEVLDSKIDGDKMRGQQGEGI
jgi:hypothetical protein